MHMLPTTMAGDVCAEPILSGASHLYPLYRGEFHSHGKQKSSSSSPPSHHDSSASTEPAPLLYRCSSASSISSIYSMLSTDSSSTTDSSSPDEAFPVIGILKKPRQQFRRGSATQPDSSRNSSSNNNSNWSSEEYSHDINDDNKQAEKDENEEEDEIDDEGAWEDEESECEIVFERHVTFNDPIATDLVSGAPVSPSPHSRIEWTALRARALLERMRKADEGEWVDCEDDEEDEEDAKGETGEIPQEFQRMREQEQEQEQKEWERGRGRADADDDDVEELVREITEKVVSLTEQK
ncbi:hypothetical protein F5Y01DRAFT_294388 [Xylaria sp. FL0043]|nr:hypothetical protein F5Y01DRAFT_294388 [Xylaria sp. FL0043]